jgi:hypothetical protein
MVVLRGAKGKKFTRVDRILMVAYAMMPDLVCPGCGQPKHEALNPDSDAWYETRHETCHGCKAIDLDQKNTKDSDHTLADKTFVIDTRPPDEPLRPWTPNLS